MVHTEPYDEGRSSVTQRELARAARSSGGERRAALQRVVLANVPVAQTVARRYGGRGVPHEELQQLAYLGLASAAERFDETRHHDFLVFALPWMTGTIRRHFRDRTWMVRPCRRVQELHLELSRVEATGPGTLTVSEAADRLGARPEEIREVLAARLTRRPRSLHEPGSLDDDRALAERLPGEETAAMRSADARLVLQPALRALTPRSRHVLRRLYLDGWTQTEIGHELGVSQMSVSRIHQRALAALRTEIGDAA